VDRRSWSHEIRRPRARARERTREISLCAGGRNPNQPQRSKHSEDDPHQQGQVNVTFGGHAVQRLQEAVRVGLPEGQGRVEHGLPPALEHVAEGAEERLRRMRHGDFKVLGGGYTSNA